MGLKIRRLIQNQGFLGIGGLLIAVSLIRLRGIVKIVSFKTTNYFQIPILISSIILSIMARAISKCSRALSNSNNS